MGYRQDIQVLRGIAVLFVVLFHLGLTHFENGFLGVDIFFVISGFLMASLYHTGNWKAFYVRRLRRLVPAYYVLILCTLIAGMLCLEWGEFKALCEQAVYALFFASNFDFWMQNSYFSDMHYTPLLHLWSLGVEMQFYLIFPAFFWFCRKWRWLSIVAFCLSALACFLALYVSPKTSFFLIPFRFWEFSLGVVGSLYFCKEGSARYHFPKIAVLGMVLLCIIPLYPVSGNALSFVQGHPGAVSLIVCFSTIFVLSFGNGTSFGTGFLSRLGEEIGKYSYSIYLVHYPVILLFFYEPFRGSNISEMNGVYFISVVLLIAVLSFLMFELVEKRAARLLGGPVLILFPVAVAVSIPIVTLIKEKQYSEYDLNVRNAIFDRDEYRCGKVFRLMHPVDEVCKLNNVDGEQKVLLLGNSHADSLKTSFTDVATQNGFEVWFVVQNQPLMDIPGALDVEDIISIVQTIKITDVVIHYSRNGLELTQLEDIQVALTGAGVTVNYLTPVPVWPQKVPELLVTAKDMAGELPRMTYQDYLNQNRYLLDAVDGIKRDLDGFYDLGREFCNPGCKVVSKEGKPFYFDRSHLTLTGADYLRPVFKRLFDRLSKQHLPIGTKINRKSYQVVVL
ncbi:hypothetical protein TH8_04925 [Thalassospira profundimaris]|nr:hypothetical protein TH8_04925 [Thalassospira profundimaris]